ncbi:hypothetical protein I6N96_01105 [Enterococcus sp. BWM-S5]|uniref:Helix-turn-helix type 11 domain-containing protein n=1 Tax=Enterococcus larvae TaxID=2794352 RepID=A0ABS4CG83_9ENTE|nr:hypothetical protein [Enterococcus larvae]MBP1044859.1 hypothetical protein [Enterococcus larvae]
MSKGLTKHQLEIVTQAVLNEHEKQNAKKKKEEKARNLRNTELLLKNYRKLKDLCDSTMTEAIPLDYPEFDLENLTLESLTIYRKKTMLMMNHVDKMLIAYEWNCGKGLPEEKRRFEVLKYRYLVDEKLTVKQLCEKKFVDQRTIYRDTKEAIGDMSVLLFGIDAIDFS